MSTQKIKHWGDGGIIIKRTGFSFHQGFRKQLVYRLI